MYVIRAKSFMFRLKKTIFLTFITRYYGCYFLLSDVCMCILGTKIACFLGFLFYRNFSANARFTRHRHSHHCCHLLTCCAYPREVYALPLLSHRAMSAGYRSGNMPGEVLLQWFSCCVNQRTQQVTFVDT